MIKLFLPVSRAKDVRHHLLPEPGTAASNSILNSDWFTNFLFELNSLVHESLS